MLPCFCGKNPQAPQNFSSLVCVSQPAVRHLSCGHTTPTLAPSQPLCASRSELGVEHPDSSTLQPWLFSPHTARSVSFRICKAGITSTSRNLTQTVTKQLSSVLGAERIMKKQGEEGSEFPGEESRSASMLISHCHGLQDAAADSTK